MASRQLRIRKAATRRGTALLNGNVQRGLPCFCSCHAQHLGEMDPHPGERCICKKARVPRG